MIAFDCQLTRPRFSLDVAFSTPGGCVALFGPSGSGKTTIARLIAGLDRPDRGRIVIGDQVLVDTAARRVVPVHKRRVGLVFQDGQLLPHLSVRQNLDFGRSFSRGSDMPAASFDTVVDLLGIGHLLSARPGTLSGGERQRVAIGRALLAAPRLLVMDEPLASLDLSRKLEILPFIERLRDELGLPIVYVSHAVEEVARLANTVVRLANGRVVSQGPPVEVFAALNHAHGDREPFEPVSFLAGHVARELPDYGMTVLMRPAGEITVPGRFDITGTPVRIAIRASSITLATEKPEGLSVRTVLEGRVQDIVSAGGPSAVATVALEGGDLISAALTRLAVDSLGLSKGTRVFALVKAVSIDERTTAVLGANPQL